MLNSYSVVSECQIRNSSVKSVYHQFGIPIGLVSPNGAYDAVNILTSSRQLQCGGSYIPNYPYNDIARPAEAYAGTIQALGGSITKSYGTVVTREMFSSSAFTVPAGSDNALVLPATTSRAAPIGSDGGALSVIQYPSSAFYGYDLERAGGTLFSGISTRSSPPFLNLFLSTATTAVVNCQAWGLSDVVMVIDANSKSIQAFI